MREFTIRSGKFAGVHLIYDNEDESRKHNIIPIKPWYDSKVEDGSWVVSDDGYVIQCLYRYKLVNKRHRSGQFTEAFRFCNGTFYVYINRYGQKLIKNFYAVATSNNKNALGNTSSLGKYMTSRKKEFVTLIGSGMSAYDAYIKAYSVKTFAKNGILVQINKLLDDPVVRGALMTELKPFVEQVEDSIKKKTGKESIIHYIVDEITGLMTDPKSKTPRERRANLELLIKLIGKELGISLIKKDPKQVQEAEYEIMAPPPLSINN